MSQEFKSKFDRMLDNDPTEPAPGDDGGAIKADYYPGIGHTRHLGMVWPDGRRLFLNYSYLVSCEFMPTNNVITLAFTTHEVAVKGVRLDLLFDELMSQLPRLLRCTDARYNQTLEADQYAINDIKVEKAG